MFEFNQSDHNISDQMNYNIWIQPIRSDHIWSDELEYLNSTNQIITSFWSDELEYLDSTNQIITSFWSDELEYLNSTNWITTSDQMNQNKS